MPANRASGRVEIYFRQDPQVIPTADSGVQNKDKRQPAIERGIGTFEGDGAGYQKELSHEPRGERNADEAEEKNRHAERDAGLTLAEACEVVFGFNRKLRRAEIGQDGEAPIVMAP